MKVYTKTGDKGTTSLIGGKRVPKNSLRLESYGTVDELNSCLGMVQCKLQNAALIQELLEIQSRLFDVGGHLATDPENDSVKGKICVNEADVQMLEQAIDRMDGEIPPMKYFVLPGGSEAVAFCHLARTICRRAERRILDLADVEPVDEMVKKYINRLSDYLFILARKLANDAGVEEHPWVPRKA